MGLRQRESRRLYGLLLLAALAPLVLIALERGVDLSFRVSRPESASREASTSPRGSPAPRAAQISTSRALHALDSDPAAVVGGLPREPRILSLAKETQIKELPAPLPPRIRITSINGVAVPAPVETTLPAQYQLGPELMLPEVIEEELPAPRLVFPAEEEVDEEPLPAPRPLPADPKRKPGPITPLERAALLGLARAEVKQGNLQAGLRRYEEYVAQFPDDHTVRREYAGVLVQADQIDRALTEYRRLLAAEPSSVDLRLIVADVASIRKEYRLAIQSLREALELAPDNLDVATQLARMYTFAGRFREAYEVYEKTLARLRPGDVNVPRRFGALLIDLQLYPEALSYLRELHRQHPTDMNIRADLVRVWARLRDNHQAIALADELSRQPGATDVVRELASSLYLAGDYEVALSVYGLLLNRQGQSQRALIGLARTHLQLFDAKQAFQILSSFKPDLATRHDYQLAWAELHQTIGQYVEALMIYKELLSIDDADLEARMALGKLYVSMNDLEKAKAQFAMIPPESGQFREARLRFAQALFDQRLFQASIEVCQGLLCEDPGNGAAQALLARNLVKIGKADEAVAGARAFLYRFGNILPVAIPVQLGLGRVFNECGKFAEAAQLFDCILRQPAGHLVEAAYGLARALDRMGKKEKAQQTILEWTCGTGRDNRNRLVLAELFYADNDDIRTVEMCNAVLGGSPEHLPALILLADAQARSAQFSGDPGPTMHTTDTILRLSTTNTRGLLARARALATAQAYDEAVTFYDQLIDLDPNYLQPRLEKARVIYSARQYDLAQIAYQTIEYPSADEKLLVELGEYARREPKARPFLEPYLHIGVCGPALHKELRRVGAMCEPAIRDGIERILLDNEALAAEQFAVHLEAEAKHLKGWRNYSAIPVYKNLAAVQPANTEALFDLGQTFGNLKQTNAAIQAFQEALTVQPLHRDSSVSLDRAVMETRPRFFAGADYFDQSGRGGLAQIERLHYGGQFYYVLGDENEWATIGYRRALLVPTDDTDLDGNIITFGCQKKCDPQCLLSAVFNIEQYENRVETRPTYDAGVRFDFNDCLTGWAYTFLYYVLEYGESLRLDFFRAGLNLGGLYRP
ncbi:MAG: tetratricopeptide repeat protein, partial [Gemmataceae bacterium]